nr:putative methyltransferase NSUN7 [Salvelinus alpinus]
MHALLQSPSVRICVQWNVKNNCRLSCLFAVIRCASLEIYSLMFIRGCALCVNMCFICMLNMLFYVCVLIYLVGLCANTVSVYLFYVRVCVCVCMCLCVCTFVCVCHVRVCPVPKVQVVVYSTCSLYPEENEEVVRGALEQAGPTEGPKLQAFRPSSSLPTSLGRAEERAGGPFFRLDPSDETNGCFLAVLTREPDLEEIESAQEVLARAAATGLLDGIDSNNPTRKERRGRQTHQAPISHARSAHTRPHATASSQSRVMEFLNRETKGSSSTPTVGSTNGGLSQRGKAKPARRRPPKPCLSNSSSYTSPYSAPNPASSLSRKNQTRLINTAAAYNNRLSPTATDPNPPAAPLTTAPFAPLVHPGPPKGRQEVLRPVALTLPPVLFPGYSPPARQIRNLPPPPQRSNPTLAYYQWKTSPSQVPLIKSSGSVNEKPVVKHPRPWL